MFKFSRVASVLIGASLLAAPMVGHSASKPGTVAITSSANLSGGSGTTWYARDDVGTSNGLPSGGICSGGTQASMNDAQTPSRTDAFDEGMMYWVNNTPVGGTLTQSGNTVTFASQTIAGLTVSLRYTALATDPVARAYLSLSNATGSPISVPVTYATNLGSDSNTQYLNTSSGDTTVGTNDKWVISADNAISPGDAVNTTVLFSGTPPVTPSAVSTTVFDCASTPGVLATYNVTVPAGGTIAIANFQRIDDTIAAANAAASGFENLTSTSALLAGLSSSEISAIRNLSVQPPPEVPAGNSATWIALAALLAALAGFTSRRRVRV